MLSSQEMSTTVSPFFCEKETVEEWRELESDPGLFSLLVQDYGVKNVKVEEVYDLSTKMKNKVYGFVFLFRYEHGDRRGRKKARDLALDNVGFVLEPNIVNKMFFAHQIIVNSCATHALLSVLLNCPDIQLGPMLARLKTFCNGIDPESKGFAIANMVDLSHAHNKHARPPNMLLPPAKKTVTVSSARALLPETYHFVSYMPIDGRLFELDGLKEYPVDHGPWGIHEDWMDLFKRIISCRISRSEDFLFNLMAVIPDPARHLSDTLRSICSEQETLLQGVTGLTGCGSEDGTTAEANKEDCLQKIREIASALPTDVDELKDVAQRDDCKNLKVSVARIILNAKQKRLSQQKLKEHLEIIQQYQIEHSRRIHNYEPFITEFVRIEALGNHLPYRVMKATIKSVPVGNFGQKKKKPFGVHRKPKTTLLVNGTKVDQ